MDKRLYIYQKIMKKKVNILIIKKFINDYNIKHTINNNGIFLNLALLSDNYIDILYDNILNFKNNDNQNIIIMNNMKNIINNIDNKNINKKNIYKDFKHNFNNIEQLIIDKSKLFNLI